jgi:hypothetical protein
LEELERVCVELVSGPPNALGVERATSLAKYVVIQVVLDIGHGRWVSKETVSEAALHTSFA